MQSGRGMLMTLIGEQGLRIKQGDDTKRTTTMFVKGGAVAMRQLLSVSVLSHIIV